MADDDEEARKARAASLRQQIARLNPNQAKPLEGSADGAETAGSETDEVAQVVDEETPSGESPREFIHRRMRDLDNKA